VISGWLRWQQVSCPIGRAEIEAEPDVALAALARRAQVEVT
jgi:hypothetical protein